ncbi:retrovirus-related pol polyprotein from transposon TNT 1-94 [Tanacetum coccineum]
MPLHPQFASWPGNFLPSHGLCINVYPTLNFDTINDRAKNNRVTGLPKFKYHKEHLCPSCEQGKIKRVSHLPKPVPNSKQRLHLLHMDLCGPMRIASINGKQYVLVIVDDYSRYTWVHFLKSMMIVPENDLGKRLGSLGDKKVILAFSLVILLILVLTEFTTKRQRKFMETMSVTFDELSAMAFEQRSSKPGLQSMTSGQITMYDDHISGQPSAAPRTVLATQAPQVLHTLMATTTTTDIRNENHNNNFERIQLHPMVTCMYALTVSTMEQRSRSKWIYPTLPWIKSMQEEDSLVQKALMYKKGVLVLSNNLKPLNFEMVIPNLSNDEDNTIIPNKTSSSWRGYHPRELE